jgi:PAS domain S-box-containing protein
MGYWSKPRWSRRSVLSVALRYGLAVVLVAIAFGTERTLVHFHFPQLFATFAFTAIAVTFWYGGAKPGILAALLSAIVRSYLVEAQMTTVARGLYDLVFIIFALLMTRVTRARDELEVKVAERTTQLMRANEGLKAEIAERKQAEYLTGQVFESSPDGISIVGRDYRYQRVNPVHQRLWSIPAERIVGMHVADLYGAEVFEAKIKPKLDKCFAEANDVIDEDWFGNSLGRRYMALSYSPLRPCSERVEAALVISRDLTEHMLASEALRESQSDLARVSRVTTMGELTASLAHEVNQPIAAAVTNANTCVRWLAGENPNLEEARLAAMRIVKDGTRAAEIISRTRQLFKKGAVQRELVDIGEVVREMSVLLHSEATRYNIIVRTELSSNLPQVVADRVQLQQVVMNLIMNGIDAMKDVDGLRELAVKAQQESGDVVLVSISDTGAGLPPEQADRIFDAFFTTKVHGTGMGLSISRSIVESHGGRLWAAASPPRGTRFCFTLPAKAVANE